MLKKVNNKIILTEEEINILNKYNITVNNMTSLDELLFMIDKKLNEFELDEDEIDELDLVSKSIAERKYYNYTNE